MDINQAGNAKLRGGHHGQPGKYSIRNGVRAANRTPDVAPPPSTTPNHTTDNQPSLTWHNLANTTNNDGRGPREDPQDRSEKLC